MPPTRWSRRFLRTTSFHLIHQTGSAGEVRLSALGIGRERVFVAEAAVDAEAGSWASPDLMLSRSGLSSLPGYARVVGARALRRT